MRVTVLILACDEALHIARAIRSCAPFAERIVVVDSGSLDTTREQARAAGGEVWENPWPGYAAQINWALDRLRAEGGTGQVMRLDADEWVTADLAAEIAARPEHHHAGFTVKRHIVFLGKRVRFGGVGALRHLRIFRLSHARCEARAMDEHMVVEGPVGALAGAIVDECLKPLDWWIAKHVGYAAREARDLAEGAFAPPSGRHAARRRRAKAWLYAPLPPGLRAGLYFLYRFVLRGGLFDGPEGRAYHVLQGFWYRYLVDVKLQAQRRAAGDAAHREGSA